MSDLIESLQREATVGREENCVPVTKDSYICLFEKAAEEIEQLRAQLAEAHRDLSSREYECTALREAIDRLKEQSVVAVAYAKDGILDDDGWAQICGTKFRKYCVPLYTSPPAAKVPEGYIPVSAILELRKKFFDEEEAAGDLEPDDETIRGYDGYGAAFAIDAMLSAQGEK